MTNETPKPPTAEPRGTFSILVDNMKVAGGIGPYDAMRREAAHYAAMYETEGVVKVRLRRLPERKLL